MAIDDLDNSIIYGLDHQARSLCNVGGELDSVQFLIGTQTLKFENQVCLLTLDEDTNQISKQSWVHPPGEVWHISSCPADSKIFSTTHSKVDGSHCLSGCTIWSVPDAEQSSSASLQLVSEISLEPSSSVCCFHWQPSLSNCKKGFVLFDRNLGLVDANFTENKCPLESQVELEAKAQHKFITGKWNPHHNCNTIATAVDTTIKGWDIRTMKPTFCIESAHIPIIRDLDFNPNRQYIMASSGDDCRVKIWDTRKMDKPLSVIASHSHWVWCVRYNPIHDQLLLSCSSDSRVVLHCKASLSSEPGGIQDLDDAEEENRQSTEQIALEDGVVRSFDEHEESVYCCEWASSDPWIFASLSYDGRVILSRVPRETKYKIMQL